MQPDPVPTGGQPVWQMVIDDMYARDHLGRERYKTPLQAFNGRDPLQDAYEEALDLAVYLKQAIVERDARAKQDPPPPGRRRGLARRLVLLAGGVLGGLLSRQRRRGLPDG
jgi:hypothetical protein